VEAVGEVVDRDGLLVIERITVRYRLPVPDEKREQAARVHAVHARACPVARSLEGGIDVRTELELVEGERPVRAERPVAGRGARSAADRQRQLAARVRIGIASGAGRGSGTSGELLGPAEALDCNRLHVYRFPGACLGKGQVR
jgi:hypothetical protein